MTILDGHTASTIPKLLPTIRDTVMLNEYKNVKNILFTVIIKARTQTHTYTQTFNSSFASKHASSHDVLKL
jgi:hypothetical protein